MSKKNKFSIIIVVFGKCFQDSPYLKNEKGLKFRTIEHNSNKKFLLKVDYNDLSASKMNNWEMKKDKIKVRAFKDKLNLLTDYSKPESNEFKHKNHNNPDLSICTEYTQDNNGKLSDNIYRRFNFKRYKTQMNKSFDKNSNEGTLDKNESFTNYFKMNSSSNSNKKILAEISKRIGNIFYTFSIHISNMSSDLGNYLYHVNHWIINTIMKLQFLKENVF